MAKRLDELMAGIEARVKNARKIPRNSQYQLPLWRDKFRGMPNSIARSALFTCASRKMERRQFKREKIATVSGCNIFYTGEELRQDDADVFLQVVHLAREHPLGDMIEVSGNGLLRALGWNSSVKSYDRLRGTIQRLKEGTVTISNESGTSGYAGSLIRKFAWQPEEKGAARTKWKIYLEREIVNLFADDSYSLLDWDKRSGLTDLSKWLHSFYYTHKTPFPYKIKTIHRLCGSMSTDIAGFRRAVKESLDSLAAIGFVKEWKHTPDTDTITVIRNQNAQIG